MGNNFRNLAGFPRLSGISLARWISAGDDVASLKRNIAANLTTYLALSGKTQRGFAREIGVGESTVSAWLAAEKLPRDEHWAKITRVLDRSIEEITRDPGIPETDLDPVLRYLRKQVNSLGYDIIKRN